MDAVVQKWGNSSAIRLTKTILKTANISESDRVRITAAPNEIIIRKASKPHIPIKERLKGYNGAYVAEEKAVTPIGKEIFD